MENVPQQFIDILQNIQKKFIRGNPAQKLNTPLWLAIIMKEGTKM